MDTILLPGLIPLFCFGVANVLGTKTRFFSQGDGLGKVSYPLGRVGIAAQDKAGPLGLGQGNVLRGGVIVTGVDFHQGSPLGTMIGDGLGIDIHPQARMGEDIDGITVQGGNYCLGVPVPHRDFGAFEVATDDIAGSAAVRPLGTGINQNMQSR